jgi:hypothetical protein
VRNAPAFYPSVLCGVISNEKARRELNFKASGIGEAVEEIVRFYM